MKQTAVEWLVDELLDSKPLMPSLIEQAKEMEKEQMRSASCPYIGGWQEGEFEKWYNEIYKNE
jgi:hypothetical protein